MSQILDLENTAGYEIEDPSFAKHMRFCTRGSTVNVRGGNLDTSVGGVLTSVLDGTSCKAILEQGSHKGKQCERPKLENGFCGKHQKQAEIEKALEDSHFSVHTRVGLTFYS